MLTRTVALGLAAAGVALPRAAALVGVASTLGVVVPPSLVLILGDAMLVPTPRQRTSRNRRYRSSTRRTSSAARRPGRSCWLIAGVVWHRRAPRVESGVPAVSAADCVTAAIAGILVISLLGAVTLAICTRLKKGDGGALFAYGMATRTLTRDALAAIPADTMAVMGYLLFVGARCSHSSCARSAPTAGSSRPSPMRGSAMLVLGSVLAIIALCAFVLDAFEMIFVVIPVVMPPLLKGARCDLGRSAPLIPQARFCRRSDTR
jgi:TRAP-type mannitol/chloroaromatic compound transport system permease large subunit